MYYYLMVIISTTYIMQNLPFEIVMLAYVTSNIYVCVYMYTHLFVAWNKTY